MLLIPFPSTQRLKGSYLISFYFSVLSCSVRVFRTGMKAGERRGEGVLNTKRTS
jgi:hypothetical protein